LAFYERKLSQQSKIELKNFYSNSYHPKKTMIYKLITINLVTVYNFEKMSFSEGF